MMIGMETNILSTLRLFSMTVCVDALQLCGWWWKTFFCFFSFFLFFLLFLRLDFNRQKQNKNKYKHTIRLHTALQTNTSWFYMLTKCVISSLATWSKHVFYTAQLIEQVHIITYTNMHIIHTHTHSNTFSNWKEKKREKHNNNNHKFMLCKEV